VPDRIDDVHGLLFKALTGHPNGYRPMVGPADMIEKSKIELSKKKPIRLAALFKKMVRRQFR